MKSYVIASLYKYLNQCPNVTWNQQKNGLSTNIHTIATAHKDIDQYKDTDEPEDIDKYAEIGETYETLGWLINS